MSTFLNGKINAKNEFSASKIVRIHVFTKIKKIVDTCRASCHFYINNSLASGEEIQIRRPIKKNDSPRDDNSDGCEKNSER